MFNIVNSNNYKDILNPNNIKYYQLAEKVFQGLGTGHTEFIYHRAMEIELQENHLVFETEKRVLITYLGNNGHQYTLGEERIDLYLVDEQVIIELKAIINAPKETEIAQVLKYQRELNKTGIDVKYGIIINFPQPGAKPAKEEIDFYEIHFTDTYDIL